MAPSSPSAPPPLPTSTPPSIPAPPPTLPPPPAPASPVKRFLWHLRLLWLRSPSLTSWRTPQAPPRLMYQLEGVLLQMPQPQTLHQSGMKVLTSLQFLLLNPRRRHHAKKHPLSNQLKKVAAKTNNKPTRCLHQQTSLLRSRGCGSLSRPN